MLFSCFYIVSADNIINSAILNYSNGYITLSNKSRGREHYLWRNATSTCTPNFSSKVIWEQLRVCTLWSFEPKWHGFRKQFLFSPFFTWLGILARLPTWDILRRWSMNVSATCVFCPTEYKSHEHLFECQFSSAIWISLASRVLPNPPANLANARSWILKTRPPSQRQATVIIKLLLQTTKYSIWREINSRIFTTNSLPLATIKSPIDHTVRDKLLSFPAMELNSHSLF